MERKELEERLIYAMASVLTKEQHDEFKKLLSQMSDKEFLVWWNMPEAKPRTMHL